MESRAGVCALKEAIGVGGRCTLKCVPSLYTFSVTPYSLQTSIRDGEGERGLQLAYLVYLMAR